MYPLLMLAITVLILFNNWTKTMYGLKYLSPAISSSYIYLQPVLVVFFAFLFSAIGVADDYTHTITLEKILYALLIFAGVYIVSKKKR